MWRILYLLLLFSASCRSVEIIEPDPVPGLANTTWTLRSIPGQEAGYPGAHVYFDPETRRLSGSTGCNILTGTYKIENGRYLLNPACATRFICFNKLFFERQFLHGLSSCDSLKVSGSRLLMYSGGKLILIFERV